MNNFELLAAGLNLGYDISLTIEADGSMWTGTDDARTNLTATQISEIEKHATKLEKEKLAAKQAVFTKLGLTADEVAALLS
jgi:hypothetical protein